MDINKGSDCGTEHSHPRYHPLVVTRAIDMNTDLSYNRVPDPDITMTILISTDPDNSLASGGGPGQRHLCGLQW